MTKRDVCMAHEPIAYVNDYSMERIYIHDFGYDFDECVYFSVLDAYSNVPSFHRATIRCDLDEKPYFKFEGSRIYLDECIRM